MIPGKTNQRVIAIRPMRHSVYAIQFKDGWVFELDLAPLETDGTPIDGAHIEYGTFTFADNTDICSDVLRAWCDNGRVLSQVETDESFAWTKHHSTNAA